MDVLVAFAVFVANASYIHESDTWQFYFGFTANSYDQMRKSIRIS